MNMNQFVCSLITVKDIQKAKWFYSNILGQTIKSDYGANVVFKGDFAIHEETHFQALIENRPISKGGNDFELYFENDSIEEIAHSLKENNVQFIHDIKIQPWQQKVIRFYDPDLNMIEIGETMENVCLRLTKNGKTIQEINALTSLSIEFITKAINK